MRLFSDRVVTINMPVIGDAVAVSSVLFVSSPIHLNQCCVCNFTPARTSYKYRPCDLFTLCMSIRVISCRAKGCVFVCRVCAFCIYPLTLLCSVHFAIELSDLSKPFKFARLEGFERLENCPTKGTYERF